MLLRTGRRTWYFVPACAVLLFSSFWLSVQAAEMASALPERINNLAAPEREKLLGEKGSGVFSGAFRTTAGMQRRFKAKLLRNFDHPVFTTKRAAALRARA